MNIYYRKQQWKLVLFIFLVLIGAGSLYYTNRLVRELASEEQKKFNLWARATEKLADTTITDENLDFEYQVIMGNTTIPILLVDSGGKVLFTRNLDSMKIGNEQYIEKQLRKMKHEHEPFVIDLGNGVKQYYYYRNSILLTKLTYYPYIQLAIILLFILVSYFAFSEARKAEQNLVWVGLSKETAHQLGTPTSSLLAWVELLKEKSTDKQLIRELHKDVSRLEKITERFSKIGSRPTLRKENIIEILKESVEYLRTRTSENIRFNIEFPYDDINIPVNSALFEWVVENVCKNAIDAMNGKGTVNIKVVDNTQIIYIDISDAGKGISKSKFKTIFKPGFTSKQRGWGLGLSVAKRIIEDYHDGKIFVYQSEPANGTTIRIVLKK